MTYTRMRGNILMQNSKQVTVSSEGLKKLQDELEYLKTTKRKEVAEAICYA